MYYWRTATKPTPDCDGMLHVDDQDNIWQWTDHTTATWVQKKSWYLKEVGQLRLPVFGIPTDNDPLKNATSVVINEWDALYSKAFVRFEFINTGVVTNMAWFSKFEISDYLASVLDKSGPTFSDIVLIKVYQVFDPSIKAERSGHSNVLYALMRGRHAYMRRRGREDDLLPAQAGLSNRMENGRYVDDWHIDTAKKFLNHFFGYPNAPAMATANEIFYFQRGTDSFYHLPKIGTHITVEGRWWYQPDSNSYSNLNVPVVGSLGSPKFFGLRGGVVARDIHDMNSLRGGNYLYDKMSGVLVYPIVAVDDVGSALRAFLVRPYGVDVGGLGYPQQYATADWELIAENSYPDSFSRKHVALTAKWIMPENDLVTFQVHDAVRFRRAAPSNLRSDSSSIPKKFEFYVQNLVTGVRSEMLGAGLQVVRRKNCMPVGVLPVY